MEEKQRKHLTIRLPNDLIKAGKIRAVKNNETFSAMIQRLLVREIKKPGKKIPGSNVR